MQREEAEKLLTQAVDQVIRFDRMYASGDVTLNRAWIPPLYLTWD